MNKLILVLMCCWFWIAMSLNALGETILETVDSEIKSESIKPIATYYLSVLPQGRAEISFNPPATKITVISQSGDKTIRCGDNRNAYTCSPGKRLELESEPTPPIVKFWGENTNETQVRLQIEVYRVLAVEEKEKVIE